MAKAIKFGDPRGADKASAHLGTWVSGQQSSSSHARANRILPSKRLTIDVSEDLHTRIKVTCCRRKARMADEIRAILEREFPSD